MISRTSLVLFATMLMACYAVPGSSAVPKAETHSRIEEFATTISELGGRARTIRVYLPAGYDGSDERYPVLYLQDAQQLFAPGPFGDWLVDETLDSLHAREGFRGVIVVGIDNSAHRWEEYSPWVNRHMHDWMPTDWSGPVQGGEGDAYLAFVANTLKPAIDARYRTLADRDHTGIGGSSMGALIAVYAGLCRPDVFGKVMAMSTAVWFAEAGGPWLSRNHLLERVRSGPVPANVRFYVDVGTAERSRDSDPDVTEADGRKVTYPGAYRAGSDALVRALRAGGVPDSKIRYLVAPGAVHNESAWSRRFGHAVQWLYP
jgi:predicted alpha/beta superfamily hydrolase